MPWWVPFWTLPFLTVRLAAGERVRTLFICHNVRPHEQGRLDQLATRCVLSRAHGLIAHSSQEVAALRSLFPHIPARLCFHPIYETFAAPGDRRAVRRRLGLRGPVLLFFGFVRPYKRLGLLVRALSQVRRVRPDCRLLIVGEFWGDTWGQIARLIEDLRLSRAVHVVNRYVTSARVAEYFHACDLLVLPYDSVTGSGALQVAYAMGRPVVATRVGGFNEVVRDGVDGILVPPGDANVLAEGILRALDPGTYPRLLRGAGTARKRFEWDRMVETIEALSGHM